MSAAASGPQRLRLAQLAPRLGVLAPNVARHRELIAAAWAEGVDLLVFPELSLGGSRLLSAAAHVALARAELLAAFADLPGGARPIHVALGFTRRAADQLHPAAALLCFAPGAREPAGVGWCDGAEPALVTLPGLGLTALTTGRQPPAEARAEVQTYLLLGAVVAAGAGPADAGRPGSLVEAEAAWCAAPYADALRIGVNRVGCEDGLVYAGGSFVLAPGGREIARLPLWAETFATVELPDD